MFLQRLRKDEKKCSQRMSHSNYKPIQIPLTIMYQILSLFLLSFELFYNAI